MEHAEGAEARRHEERRMQRRPEQCGQTSPALHGRHLHNHGKFTREIILKYSLRFKITTSLWLVGGHPVEVDRSDLYGQLYPKLARVRRPLVAHFVHAWRPGTRSPPWYANFPPFFSFLIRMSSLGRLQLRLQMADLSAFIIYSRHRIPHSELDIWRPKRLMRPGFPNVEANQGLSAFGR